MRQISRVDIGLLVLCLSLCLASTSEAQTSTQPRKQTTQPQQQQQQAPTKPAANSKAPPKNTPARSEAADDREAAEELQAQLDEIVGRWEIESKKIKTLHGKQSKSEFNHVFEVEKQTKGVFFFETPDKGRIDMISDPPKKDEVSKRANKSGDPYALESGPAEKWICTGDAILQINDKERTYQRIEIPENARGSNIVHTPLPFLFGMTAVEAKTRFKLSLKANTKDSAKILVIPLMEKDKQNYKKALVTLSKKTYLPMEVRMLGEESTEVAYTFEDVKMNDKGLLPEIFKKDPYHPSLKGYRLVLPNDDPADIQPARATNGGREPKKVTIDPAPSIPPKRTTQSTTNGQKSSSMNK